MKFLKQGVCLALLGAGLAAVPASLSTSAAATPSAAVADDQSLARDLRSASDGSLSIQDNPATGQAGLIRATGAKADLLPGTAADSAASAADKADAFVAEYGSLLGAGSGELTREGVVDNGAGWTVRFTQSYRDVPVFGSLVKANVDPDGDLTSVSGYAAPDLDLSTEPRFSGQEIADRAVAFVKAEPPTSGEESTPADTTGLASPGAQLVVYRKGFIKGEPGAAVLAWAVEVGNGAIREQLVYDARTGKPLNRYSLGTDAIDRELYEASLNDNGTPDNPGDDAVELEQVWGEGDAFPGTLNQDQQNLVNSSGESYWLFNNTFGRDSYDGAGATMQTVNNDPRIACPNANWNGVTTNYCNGVTSDDVVSHEWGHAYTEYTSGLIYQFQSGALNESYSDVWGETLDIINGREDEGEAFETKRPDGGCTPAAPPRLNMSITAPASVAGPCFAVAASGTNDFTTTPVSSDVVVATDAANAAGPSTTDGCSAFTNAAAIDGAWAYVDRGTCTFQAKVDNAEAAGATGLVIGNNNTDIPAGFSAVPDDPDFYGVMVGQTDGNRFKAAGTTSVTAAAEDTSTRVESTRWLIGEKSTAFGGAIRDMWTPTCYGDPGKVSDAEYKCDPLDTDAGGVHSNSGVPNHAYALAVDGGTYNGQTITAIGLDQAAAIWWRAQTAYLTPSSNFTDAANGLEASCADLVGEDINVLTTETAAEPELATPITAADCTELQQVMTAVEMRTPVTRCNFQPVLSPGSVSLCGAGTTTTAVLAEDFEDGLAGWDRDSEVVFPGGDNAPWTADATPPGGRTGGVVRAIDDAAAGDCLGGAGDVSSRDSIISPVITMPGTTTAPKLSFDHYVATEAGFDGGNVKVSVNDGAFTLIPASAFLLNPYNATIASSATNTSPLAGQPGFTGADGGQLTGSWGTSVVDLGAMGLKAGDRVRVRFDFGRDGCGGLDGWYVDNVSVTICTSSTGTPPAGGVVASKSKAKAPRTVERGEAFKVKVKVKSVDGSVVPTGKIKIKVGGKTVGKGTVNAKGKARIKVRTGKLELGKTVFKVKYLGSGSVAKSKDRFVVFLTR